MLTLSSKLKFFVINLYSSLIIHSNPSITMNLCCCASYKCSHGLNSIFFWNVMLGNLSIKVGIINLWHEHINILLFGMWFQSVSASVLLSSLCAYDDDDGEYERRKETLEVNRKVIKKKFFILICEFDHHHQKSQAKGKV